MAQLKDYICPNCGGALNFDSKEQKMKCPYCDSLFEMAQFEQEENTASTEKSSVSTEESTDSMRADAVSENGMFVYSCQYCGAEILGNETMGASTCPYCGNQIVLKEKFSGDLQPDYVIPFQLDKKEAIRRLQSYLEGKKLLPPVFKDRHHIEEIKGVYVPYWLFDAQAEADMRYETMKMTGSWRRGDDRFEEFSHFEVIRRGKMDFANLPADASKRMPDDLMESLEPYDMKAAVDFQMAYLAGYVADRYDVKAEECQERIRQRITKSVQDAVEDTVRDFGTIKQRSEHVEIEQTGVKYALFPVWLLNTIWNGETYTFAMNGQTGRFLGNLPIDQKLARQMLLKKTLLYGLLLGIATFLFLMW